MRTFHRLAFATRSPALRLFLYPFSARIDGTRLEGPVTEIEYWIKFISSRCRRCGDCTLAELAFLCPQSQCPKFLVNGQCSGFERGVVRGFSGKTKVHLPCAPTSGSKHMAKRNRSGENIFVRATGHWIRPPHGPTIFWGGTIAARRANSAMSCAQCRPSSVADDLALSYSEDPRKA